MGANLSNSGTRRPMAEINVTPMVDVMLVLLIIFMVTAPMMTQGVPVQLPRTKAQPLDVQDGRLTLSITAAKKIFLGDIELPYEGLHDKLVGNLKLQNEAQVYLHADRTLPYGFVVDIMSTLKDAGVTNVGMVTDPQ